jgi:hypothetical protein
MREARHAPDSRFDVAQGIYPPSGQPGANGPLYLGRFQHHPEVHSIAHEPARILPGSMRISEEGGLPLDYPCQWIHDRIGVTRKCRN